MTIIASAPIASTRVAAVTTSKNSTCTQCADPNDHPFTNYISYRDPETDEPRIGHYDLKNETIQPLSFASGTRISNLYQIIEAQGLSHIIPIGDAVPISGVKILPPLTGRDVLCVGKNYAEHAKEFNSSGFDSSDKVDQPSHPVIFTKRFTSIIAHGEEILPHGEFTQTADYEGEIGVIIGKAGVRIKEEEAMGYVWGYTIVNDVTARERQRDHKQFYVGKSPDTFCPMGPIAVPASKLEKVLRVQTRVNGELRQDATTDDLIFSIPYLIKTMSEGQTLMPGDVLATGTPAGVGFGQKPPVYLQPGDEVAITVTGLSTLKNRIAAPDAQNHTLSRHLSISPAFQLNNTAKTSNLKGLTLINHKPLHYKSLGNSSNPPLIFIHGLGATNEYFTPLITHLNLDTTHNLHLYDLEGHGLSPTHPLTTLTLPSLATDLHGIFTHAGISSGATLIADGMGCFIALQFMILHPGMVSRLIMLSPPPLPLPEALSKRLIARAEIVRSRGMAAVVDSAASSLEADSLSLLGPIAGAARRISLLGQDGEGYAKACGAFGRGEMEGFGGDRGETVGKVEGGQGTKVFTLEKKESGGLGGVYEGLLGEGEWTRSEAAGGHWSVFQELDKVAGAVREFL